MSRYWRIVAALIVGGLIIGVLRALGYDSPLLLPLVDWLDDNDGRAQG